MKKTWYLIVGVVLLVIGCIAYGLSLIHIYKDAATEGADCVVTPCPLCQMQLDMFQKEAKEVVGGGKDMPILHMSQLVGLSLIHI